MAVYTTEKDFEATIESYLVGASAGAVKEPSHAVVAGLHFYRKRNPEDYSRSLCLDSEPLFDFILATQAQTWNNLKEQHGSQAKERFLKRLTKKIEERGTLDVLHKGVTDLGCHFSLAYFKPETTLNEEHQRLYKANIFTIIRQVKYSLKNENSIDVVLFLNGLPIFTAELKNPLKGQTVEHAIKQYRTDRDPKELLLKFGRCLGHFAVDTDLVFFTTHLEGSRTRFFPFNKGNKQGAGNPPNPDGFRTAYLWEHVWQPDNILEIINHFLRLTDVLDEDGKPTGKKALIFPRYHQLTSVRAMVVDAKANGAGRSYLVEHSAGSGKSNSIAWLAHQLAGLHNAENKRVFDSIIVITDRRVLDWQLQQTVKSFEQTRGLVTGIDEKKAKSLAEALAQGKDIIVCTLQTFPFVTDKITEIQAQSFAVLIDEAHSSQTGETSRTLKHTLAVASIEDAASEDEQVPEDDEDEINRRVGEIVKRNGRLRNVSFFAFTATPKSRTLELFGTPQPNGTYLPFSLYSMRQAIDEKFICDVLKNYTTFKAYFALHKKVEDDPLYPKKKAIAQLRSYADLHEHAVRTKSEIMIEHFDTQIKSRINGLAKAMVVGRSRLHAVRYKLAFDRLLRELKLPYKALVAFSGKVRDPETGIEYSESGMNGIPENQTAPTFRQARYRFLIVAEKFQTGFDQPLLHTMYVDKKLSGVHAVQTLSRLNRTHPHKTGTMVLDFVNNAGDIQEAFQPYYETTVLSEGTDPNLLYDLKRKAEDSKVYFAADVTAFASVYFSRTGNQQKLRSVLDQVVTRYEQLGPEEREAFKKIVVDFVTIYAFLSHVIRFTDVELEKSYQFLRHLRTLLKDKTRLPVDVTDKINMESYTIQQTSSGTIALLNQDGELQPATDVGTGVRAEDKVPLSEIIQYVNENFGTEFADADHLQHFALDMERRLADKEGLRQALDPEINQSEENRRLAFNDYFDDILQDMIDTNVEIYKKIVDDEKFGDLFRVVMFKKIADIFARPGGER
jgi:type I restriction enzyme R subunit